METLTAEERAERRAARRAERQSAKTDKEYIRRIQKYLVIYITQSLS